ncbi:hypothetical protein YC2023_118350 [Brassica napus]
MVEAYLGPDLCDELFKRYENRVSTTREFLHITSSYGVHGAWRFIKHGSHRAARSDTARCVFSYGGRIVGLKSKTRFSTLFSNNMRLWQRIIAWNISLWKQTKTRHVDLCYGRCLIFRRFESLVYCTTRKQRHNDCKLNEAEEVSRSMPFEANAAICGFFSISLFASHMFIVIKRSHYRA